MKRKLIQAEEKNKKIKESSEFIKVIKCTTEEKNNMNYLSIEEDSSILEQLIHPLTKKEFFKEHLDKKIPFCINNSKRNRFDKLVNEFMCDLNIEELLENTNSNLIHVWLKGNDSIESFTLNDEILALKLHNISNASLYCRAPNELEQFLVGELTKDLGLNFAGYFISQNSEMDQLQGEIETFFSKKGHVTDYHFDFQENFTLQLKGKKKWTVHPSYINDPLRGYTPHFKDHDTFEQQMKLHKLQNPNFDNEVDKLKGYEIILEPGDVLYHPSGLYHKVECKEDSISINISLISKRWSELVLSSLNTILNTKKEWSSINRLFDINKGRKKVSNLLEDLKSVINEIKPIDILPDSIMFPRNKSIEVDNEIIEKENIYTKESVFRINPTSVLVQTGELNFVLHNNFGMKK